ncbi:PRC-barrel domain-containing protein [Denitrobaculum tricleocarpae]|uniref:PRC-barrel domain-containing protein n=1 Tax=Denitrobaculum tricleocarpae TaxID=2591009 RepID=UPI0015D1D674|nr:PRC-barrel domain-containing protein [Denitrobaculum tricleocarpae]
MHKRLLMAVSGAALMASGAVWADQTKTESKDMMDKTTETAESAVDATAEAAKDAADATTEAAENVADETSDALRFESFKDKPEAFSGEIAGGYTAEELIGKNLVDAKGESVGEIHDLLVGANNKIERALVDVGGFIGIGEHRVALNIEELKQGEDDVFTAEFTKEDLEAMPEYEQQDSFWNQMTQ